jgi:hypothetical protein
VSTARQRGERPRRLTAVQQRLVLGAIGLVVVVVLVVLLAGGGGDDDSGGEISLPNIGLKLTPPDGWARDVSDESVELRSPDETVVLTVSSPVAGRQPRQVKEALRRQLRERLAPAKITKEGPGRLGDREATSFQMSGQLRGRPVTAVALVEDTRFRTYAVTLFTGAPSAKAVRGARGLLRSVRLSRPEGAAAGAATTGDGAR